MPQLDPSHFTSQIFWLLILFSVFYMCVKYIILPRMEHIMNMRSKLTGQNDIESEKIERQIEELKDLQKRRSEETNAEIKAMKLESDKKLQEYYQKSRDDIQRDIDKKLSAATKDIDESIASLHSSKDVSKAVLNIASQIIEEATSTTPSEAKLKKYG